MTTACETPRELVSYMGYDVGEELDRNGGTVSVMTPVILMTDALPHVHVCEFGEDTRYEMFKTCSHEEALAGIVEELVAAGYRAQVGDFRQERCMDVTTIAIAGGDAA